MRGAPGGPRLLLRRLREIMAEPVGAQVRLDRIVVLIAANMVAEVCSLYVMRSDGVLELYATEGLNRTAVHQTTLKAGEGLVGLIAREAEPLALSDAQTHPAYSYKPETGEELYHGFLGVPLLRGGQTIGVLVVQNKALRLYPEDEIEALQTTAMVLAELVASGELQALAAPGTAMVLRRPLHQKGVSLCDGVGLGHVVLHEPRVIVRNIIAESVPHEIRRLDQAIAGVRSAIDELIERGDVAHHGEHREVLETFRMFAHDKGWLRRIREAVLTGLTAEAAVERVQSDARARMMRQTDPYLRDRLHDLDELANRLLHKLIGRDLVEERANLPENAILVARSMGPAALLDYDRSRLRGLMLEEAGPASHIAIVARALGIPAVGEIANATSLVEPNDAVIVDGIAGEIQIRPNADVEAAYAAKAKLRARKQEQYRKLRDVAAITKDGITIDLMMNAGLLVDMPHLHETGASGIGLFRTELQFMVSPQMPSVREQQKLYEDVIATSGEYPVVFRTLDIGGDKVLPYMDAVEEENPALGWRAIRIGLDRPGLLRMQLRALLKAARRRNLHIMFPMIATADEFRQAKALVDKEKAYLTRHGYALPYKIMLGAMVEVPALLFELSELAKEADFLSVGSNDLFQFLYAVDRDNRLVADRFDPLSLSSLRALKTIAVKADQVGCPVTLCGEMGSRPLEAMALIGLGFRRLSMSPASIGPVKAMILSVNLKHLSEYMEDIISCQTGEKTVREHLSTFAHKAKISL